MQLHPTDVNSPTNRSGTSLPSPRLGVRHLRNSVIGTALAMLWLLALWLGMLTSMPHAAAQSVPDAAGATTVIVQFDDQTRIVRRINFTTPLSGFAALQQSGLSVVYTDTAFGPAVCAIEGVGCPATDCFCNTNYWGYNYWDGQAWQGYATGPGSSTISQTGSVEGWHWGTFGDSPVSALPTLAAASALDWLHTRQVITNGGYGGAGASIESLLAVGANRIAATEWRQTPTGPSLASYISLNTASYTKGAGGAAGKTAVALSAADACLPVGAITPKAHYSPTLGSYSEHSGSNSWAILGAVAAGESVSASAVESLRVAATIEGGWEWMVGWGADTNTTALAIQALIAAGDPVASAPIQNGLAYLASAQEPDGGFAYAAGTGSGSDANSTAYTIQALIAAGEEPASPTWTISNSTPISYLLSLQVADGSFEWQAGTGSNQLATVQVIPALLGQPHPAATRELVSCPVAYLPSAHKP